MNPVLFLDIDGVLNSHLSRLHTHEIFRSLLPMLDPKAVKRLIKALQQVPRVEVVIMSSWRNSIDLEQFNEIFKGHNIIVSKMDNSTDLSDSIKDKSEGIRSFLKKHNPAHFAILDDDTLFNIHDPLHKKQIKTSFYLGMQDKHIQELVDVLNE